METLSRTEKYEIDRLVNKWCIWQTRPDLISKLDKTTFIELLRFQDLVYKKLKEINEEYKKVNPNGKVLTMCITKNSMSITNDYYDTDNKFPISVDIYDINKVGIAGCKSN